MFLKQKTTSARRNEFCRRCLQNVSDATRRRPPHQMGAIQNDLRTMHTRALSERKTLLSCSMMVLQYVITYD
jgi:hypothetical protein